MCSVLHMDKVCMVLTIRGRGGERNKLKERVMNGVWKNTEEVMDVPE